MKQLILPVNDDDHVFGNPGARIELVEYGDYECPHCGRAYPIVKDIQQKFGADLKFVFRNFPLSKIHANAFAAAVATEAASLQEKFWEMHDIIFENQRRLDQDHIYLFADTLGLDLERFEDDMQRKSLADKVEQDFESGLRSGVSGTPTFFINGKQYDGDWEGEHLYRYLKREIALTSVSHK